MRARGSITTDFIIYIAIAAAIVGVIGYGYYKIDRTWETTAGKRRGSQLKQAEWDAANVAAEKARIEAAATRAREAEATGKRLAAAEDRARAADDQVRFWQRKARDKPADVDCTKRDAGGNPRVTLSHSSVGVWDGAWTGREGQPVFGDPGSIAARSTASGPTGPELADAIDNQRENATRASKNARQCTELIELIRSRRGANNPR